MRIPDRIPRHGDHVLVPSTGPEIHGIEVRQVLHEQQTQYQHLLIVETSGFGRALYLDGDMQSATGDEHVYHEALVMPALLGHPGPRKAMVLGGGEGAPARELLRDPGINSVHMVELDPEVVAACRKHLPQMNAGVFQDSRFRLTTRDARHALEDERDLDLLVHDLTDPVDGGPSCPLFETPFFEACRRALSPSGSLVVQMGALKLSPEPMQTRALSQLREVFRTIMLYSIAVPSFGCSWVFALAQSHPLEPIPSAEEIDSRIHERQIRGLRAYDGVAHVGLRHPAPLVREIDRRP